MGIEKPVSAVGFIISAGGESDGRARHRTFGWRVAAGRTSFYIKVMHEGMSDFKISLHGPDERPKVGPPVLKLDYDGRSPVEDSNSRVLGKGVNLPLVFEGQKVTAHVRRVIRFNFAAELFDEGLPIGYNVKMSKSVSKAGGHAKWTMPEEGGLQVDVYLTEPGADPYWPNKEAIVREDAGLGPLVNAAGQSLTLVGKRVKHPHKRDPNHQPLTDEQIDDMERPLVRWVSMKADDKGLLWITEKVGPPRLLDETDDQDLQSSPGTRDPRNAP